MSDFSIIIKSSDFISNVNEIYKYSIWKLCDDELGNNIIQQSIDDNSIQSILKISKNSIDFNRDYYLFVKYVGSLTSSNWSNPIQIQFKQKRKIESIELNFRQCHNSIKSLDAYLTNYFDGTQIDCICNYDNMYYKYNENYGVSVVGDQLFHSLEPSSQVQTKICDYVILDPSIIPAFKLTNVFKPKKIFIKGYFKNSSNSHTLLLRFTGNVSKEEYYVFSVIDNWGNSVDPNGNDAFYSDNMNIKLDLITPDIIDNYFEYELNCDDLTHCFTNEYDTSYTVELINPWERWRTNGLASVYNAAIYLTQLNIYSENYLDSENNDYLPLLTQFPIPFISNKITLFALPYDNQNNFANKINFKITNDVLGNDVIINFEKEYFGNISSRLFEYSNNIEYNKPYYGFVRYYINNAEYTNWSIPVKIVLSEPIMSKSNRLMYRHWSDLGTVLETETNKIDDTIIILDSSNRTKKLAFGTYRKNSALPNIPSPDRSYINNSDTDFNINSLPIINDALFDTYWCNIKSSTNYNGYDPNTAKYNCDIWIKYEGTSDQGGVSGVPIVKFARDKNIYGIAADVPNINQLKKIFIESETIDELELISNGNYQITHNYLLGRSNPNGFWSFDRSYIQFASSTEGSANYISSLNNNGYIGNTLKNSATFNVIPIIESFNFKECFINTPTIPIKFNNNPFNLDNNITFTSSAFKSNINQKHLYSNWKLCSDINGNNIIIDDKQSLDLTSHIFNLSSINLINNSFYYIFVQYIGEYNGKSDWSIPIKVIYTTNIIDTPSGRKLYRHPSNMGSILEYNDENEIKRVLILDAKYRNRGYKFGTYGTDTTLENGNYNGYVDGNVIQGVDPMRPITDETINSIWDFNTNTSKQNCDVWMSYSENTDTDGTKGCPPVQHCRNIKVDDVSCDLPNLQILCRIYVEYEELDKLDPTVNDYPNLILGPGSLGSRFTCGAFSSNENSANNIFILFYQSSIEPYGKNATTREDYGTANFLTIPILELFGSPITTPVISNVNCNDSKYPNCILYIRSSNFISQISEEHIATNIKIYKSENFDKIIYQTTITSENLIDNETLINFHFTVNSNLFIDGETYNISIQYIGSNYSNWSTSKKFIYNKSIFTTDSNRKLYRHSSNEGTVLEFLDKNILRKVVILDAKYRNIGKFGTYNVNNPKLTDFTQNNSASNTYLDGIAYYAPQNLIPISDSTINTIWTTVDNKTSKQNNDSWMGYVETTDNQNIKGVPCVQHCRSINIKGTNAELPNFNTLARIIIEASNINELDPSISEYPNYQLGKYNPNGTAIMFPDTYNGSFCSSTESAATTIRIIIPSANCGKYLKNVILGIIPIIEITEGTITKSNIVFSGLYKTETNYKLIIQYLLPTSTTITTVYTKLEYILKDNNQNIISQDVVQITNISECKTEINLPLSLDLNIELSYNLQISLISGFDENVKSLLSDNVEIIFPKVVPDSNLPSGRKLYRHESDLGSVLEFIDQGIYRKILVLDAKYRSDSVKFGLYKTDVGLPYFSVFNLNKYNSNCIFGPNNAIESISESLPILTDLNLENVCPPNFDNLRSKENCDKYIKYTGTITNPGSSYGGQITGCPAVEHCRNIEILGSKCDLPNINTLFRIFLESDNIDNLDISGNEYNSKLLGIENSNNRLQYNIYTTFIWSSTIGFNHASHAYQQCILYLNNNIPMYTYANRFASFDGQLSLKKQVYGLAIPILELIDDAIDQPTLIINKAIDNSSLVVKSSNFNSKMTENHVSTSWKICTDVNGEIIIESSLNDEVNLLNFEFNTKLLTNDSTYYIFVQYHGSYTKNSNWSDPYKVIYKNGYLYSACGRLLYRHSSNEGTVLEYDQLQKHRKILILDAKYRFGSAYGLQGINTVLSNTTYLNTKNNGIIDGTTQYDLLSQDLPILTDLEIESLWPSTTFDVNTPRQNGDILMHYDTTVDDQSNTGPIAVIQCHNINVSSMHAEVPTINELYPISLELKNIDNFDISLDEYSQNRLFPTSADDGLFFNGADYHYLQSSTETTYASNDDGSLRNRVLTNNLQLSYTQKLYKISILPIIDISDEFIDKPKIIYSSSYVLNNSKNVFVKTNPIIPTNSDQIIGSTWKLCSDKEGLNILKQDEVDNNSTVHHFENIDSLIDGEVYFVFVKFKYALFGYTDWSISYPFVFSKFGTPGGRKIYRHESDMGSVLEYYDASYKKIIVLDALYRDFLQFGAYNYNMTSLTGYTNYNHTQPTPPYIKYSHTIHGLDESYSYSLDIPPIQMSDFELNKLWVNSIDSKTAKYNCDQWMTRNTYTDSASIKGVPAVNHCRSILINDVKCDLPNIQQLMRIFVEADMIDSLDPTLDSNLTKALGLKNSNGFWGATNAFSSTNYNATGIRQVGSGQGCSYVNKNIARFVIPILEI